MKKEMLINVLQPEECRIAIVEDGILEELYVERTSHESYVGNIYKGRIVNIEPSIQAAFVDFGVGRNGFLHVSDVEPAYYRHLEQGGRFDNGGGGGRHRNERNDRRPPPRQQPAAFAEPREEEPLVEEVIEETETRAEVDVVVEPPERERKGGRRGRGSSRGRGQSSRGRRPRSDEPTDEARPLPQDSGAAPSEGGEAMPPTVRGEEPHDETRFMGSAERRTDKDRAHSGPLEPSSDIRDEDLFFPKSGSEDDSRAPRREESYRDPEPTAEPVFEERPGPVGFDKPWEDERVRDNRREPFRREEEERIEEPLTDEESPPLEGDFGGGDWTAEPAEDWNEPSHGHEEGSEEPAPFAPARPEGLEEFGRGRGPRRRDDRRDDRRGGPRRDDRRGGPRRNFSRPAFGRPKPLIQDIFKRGQEVLVQVIKEGIGTKGPTLSTYISIAGRYLVLMPGLNRIGVSRKIADEEQRRRLREVLHELKPPKGLGFIIRTAGMDKNKKELQRDLAYLSRLWQVVVRRIRKIKSPAEIYQESDMITRTIRDTFTAEIDTIWVDEPAAFEHAQEFLQIVMPRYASRINLYSGSEPMFHKYGIEKEIARIQQRHVPLPNGGSIVIDQTEALVAIDVNSGNFRADNNAEETAYQMNLLAAKEIARQLRLRDLGGVIVNDFIDMREEKHRRGVERGLRDAIKRDRARTKILKISQFGIIEMTRQRIRPSLKRSVYQDCPHCIGTGQVKTCESMSIDVMRHLQLAAHQESVHRIQVRVAEEVASYLLNKKRKEINRLEETGDIQIHIAGAAGLAPETLEFVCYDNNNNDVKFTALEEPRPRIRPRR